MAVANDRRGGEPRRGEEGGVLSRALVPGGRQPLFLLQGEDTVIGVTISKKSRPNLTGPLTDPAEEAGAGTGLGCAHHLNPDPLNLCLSVLGGQGAPPPHHCHLLFHLLLFIL